ncbi:HNH endonuclease [Campylobacter sp. MOP51]|uniref:HNH endonuclease n=1 Tax=Campylobacter canis TaxID=3378588 RepID=UPI003C33ADFC
MEYFEKNILFKEFLLNNSKLSSESVKKYCGAIKSISKDMQKLGKITKNLFDMNLHEFDQAFIIIFQADEFIEKDKVGHKMYSNALKHYKYFLLSKFDNESFDDLFQITQKEQIVKIRIGQSKFRKDVLLRDESCVVTGISNPSLLIASHIKPWFACDDFERTNPDNGILLSATYDRLFDRGLITFKRSLQGYKILVSSFVNKQDVKKLGLSNDLIVYLKSNDQMNEFLKYHNEIIFLK